MKTARLLIIIVLVIIIATNAVLTSCNPSDSNVIKTDTTEHLWRGWNKYQIRPADTLIRYGRELIENTSYYLGPHGIVAQITNGMNCQNCHLDGGTVPWGNNYSAVVSLYPRFREKIGRASCR